jgi:hypothetical protein
VRAALATRALALALALATAGQAGGEDGAPPAAARGVHASLAEALARARAEGRLLVVRLAEPGSEPWPPDTVASLAERYVLVELPAKPGHAEADAFRVRAHALHDWAETLAVAPTGAVLARRVPDAREGALAAMREAERETLRFAAQAAALAARTGEAARIELADHLLDHRDLEGVVALLREPADREDASIDTLGRLASALGALGRRDEEATLLRRMLARWPEHPEAIQLRIALATMHLDVLQTALVRYGRTIDGKTLRAGRDALLALLAATEAEGDVHAQTEVRWEIAEAFHVDRVEPLLQFDWIVANDPTGSRGAEARERQAAAEALAAGTDALEVRLRTDPETLRAGVAAALVVTVANVGAEPLPGVAVTYDAHGDFEPRTQARGDVGDLAPGDEFEVEFALLPRSAGDLHVLVGACVPSRAGFVRGLRRRIPVAP